MSQEIDVLDQVNVVRKVLSEVDEAFWDLGVSPDGFGKLDYDLSSLKTAPGVAAFLRTLAVRLQTAASVMADLADHGDMGWFLERIGSNKK